MDAVYIPLPELAARGVVGAGARGRQARALREAAVAPSGGGGARLRRRRAQRSRARRGVHVAPPPAGAAAPRAGARAGRGAARARRLLVPAAAGGERALGRVARRRRPDGRGLLLRVGRALPARRARRGHRPDRGRRRWTLASWARWRFASGALAHFDCGFDLSFRDELEVVGERGALFLDDPWHSRAGGDRGARGRRGGVDGRGGGGGSLRLRARGLRARVRGRDRAPLRARRRASARRGRSPRCTRRRTAVVRSRSERRSGAGRDAPALACGDAGSRRPPRPRARRPRTSRRAVPPRRGRPPRRGSGAARRRRCAPSRARARAATSRRGSRACACRSRPARQAARGRSRASPWSR